MLSHARGSLYEVQAQAIAANRLGFLDIASAEHLKKRATAAGRELAGLITWVERRAAHGKRNSRDRSNATSN